MMSLQHSEGLKLVEGSNGFESPMKNPLHKEEVAIIDGALSYREMHVSKVMTPIKDTFMISADECLSYKVMMFYCCTSISSIYFEAMLILATLLAPRNKVHYYHYY